MTGVNVAGLGDCQVWAKYPENEALISLNTPNNMNSEEVFQNLRSRKFQFDKKKRGGSNRINGTNITHAVGNTDKCFDFQERSPEERMESLPC